MLQYGKPFGVGFGFFVLIAVIVMSVEIVKTYRKGFMWWVGSTKIYKKRNPIKFKIIFVVDILVSVVLTFLSIHIILN
jgi:hypothetical protein